MRTRNRSGGTSAHRWLPAATLGLVGALSSALAGCPNQELAPLTPCTVSGVSIEVPQTGVDKVDLLFMIDNSGSMAEEQKKLADVLPTLVKVLTTGQMDPNNPKPRPDFPPVKSMHIGVISSDLGVNLAPAIPSCGAASFDPTAPDPANTNMAVQMMAPNNVRLDKPFGDNGQLLTSTLVAQAGIYSRPFGTSFSTPVGLVVQPDPSCQGVNLPQRFITFETSADAAANTAASNKAAAEFGCIAKLGKNGCGLEQQLESLYKALAPSSEMFSRNTRGQGTAPGVNGGFLREDAVLAMVLVTDEEDCSIPDTSSELFNRNSTAFKPTDINTRCGKPENQQYLYPVKRYIEGIKKLKSDSFQDRLIFAAIVGIPMAVNLGNKPAHSGKEELDGILARGDMQFMVRQSSSGSMEEEPVPVCTSPQGDGTAAPARRFVEVASAFGDNGVVTSICENEYSSALGAIITKIAAQLSGACLPRQLRAGPDGKVVCDVVEIKAPNDQSGCDPNKGRTQLPSRKVGGSLRTVCAVNQVPVINGTLQTGAGWYYDNFTAEVKQECQMNPQRIAFTAGAETSSGSQARFECFQPVAPAVDQNALGREALNMSCGTSDDTCAAHSDDEYRLICIAGGCQIACNSPANCPDGWHCVADAANNRKYCVNPTCPPAISGE